MKIIQQISFERHTIFRRKSYNSMITTERALRDIN